MSVNQPIPERVVVTFVSAVEMLVTFLIGQPEAVKTLLVQRADNGSGRCRCCGVGAQHGQQMWPCTIHYAATLAATRAVRIEARS